MPNLTEYLTISEAAAYLGVSPNTLRNWGRGGKVPMHRNPINEYRLFRRSDLDDLLKQVAQARSEARGEHRKTK